MLICHLKFSIYIVNKTLECFVADKYLSAQYSLSLLLCFGLSASISQGFVEKKHDRVAEAKMAWAVVPAIQREMSCYSGKLSGNGRVLHA